MLAESVRNLIELRICETNFIKGSFDSKNIKKEVSLIQNKIVEFKALIICTTHYKSIINTIEKI